jgi:methionyl-tRNA formyltransferase
MKILFITQNDPFYLSKNIGTLLKRLPNDHIVVGAVVTSASPFGKRENFFEKALKTQKIFGLGFFLHYSFRFIYNKLFNKSVTQVISEYGIKKIEIQGSINSVENLNIIKSYNPDLLISILGNQIFKRPLIDLAPKGCINLHTSLLPKYRGLMPTFWVMKNNEECTGVSVFFVNDGIDSGPIIVQEKVKIGEKTQQQLIKETKQIGMNLILKSIDLIDKNELKLIENPENEKSYFSFPIREDVKEFKRQGKKFF